LPNNHAALARIIGISVNDFQAIAEQLLCFWSADADGLHHKRCDIELERQDRRSKKMSDVAKAAAQKRKQKQSHPGNSSAKAGIQDKTRQDNTENKNNEFFDEFWKAYPNRGQFPNPRQPAKLKFFLALKKGVDPKTLIEAAKAYSLFVDQEKVTEKFVAQARTWLNQERWLDDPTSNAGDFKTVLEKEADQWRARVKGFVESGHWFEDVYGSPQPGAEGSRVPAEILREFGL